VLTVLSILTGVVVAGKALLLLAHLGRDVEYLAHWGNPFCGQ
jgi:hypothetical protein